MGGFEVACCPGNNNRFPEFKNKHGEFEFQRLATGVFYIGNEISLNQLNPNLGELFFLYNGKSMTIKGIEERMINPYFKEICKAKGRQFQSMKKIHIIRGAYYGDLRSICIKDESISLKSLGLLAHSKKFDLRFLSNDVGYLFRLCGSNGGESGSDDILTLYPFGKKGYYSNVSDSRNSS